MTNKKSLLAVLTMIWICLSASGCTEGNYSYLEEETDTPIYYTTSVSSEITVADVDYSDNYTDLYKDMFLPFSKNQNRCDSDKIIALADDYGLNYSVGNSLLTRSGGYPLQVTDSSGNAVVYLFSDADYLLRAEYHYTPDTYISYDHRYANCFAVKPDTSSDEIGFTTFSAAETEFFTTVSEPLAVHDSDYGIYSGNGNLRLKYGQCQSAITTVIGDKTVLVVKAKIATKSTNAETIQQNYDNIEDLILNQNCNNCDEIQYWAVTDMLDGNDQKVISFTVPASVITKISGGDVTADTMHDHVTDLWLHQSIADN